MGNAFPFLKICPKWLLPVPELDVSCNGLLCSRRNGKKRILRAWAGFHESIFGYLFDSPTTPVLFAEGMLELDVKELPRVRSVIPVALQRAFCLKPRLFESNASAGRRRDLS